jgi:anti-sigma factor RsiW
MSGVNSVGASMTCEELESSIHPYVDGEFDGPERQEVEAHLAQCASCREVVAFARAFRSRVRQAERESSGSAPAPEALRQSIAAGLAIETRRRRWRRLRPSVTWSVAAAATAATLVLVIRAQLVRERASHVVSDAVIWHQRDLPLEIQDAQLPNVRSWFRGKVDFAPNALFELPRASLVGARISSVSGKPAAYLQFAGRSQRRVSLLVFDAPDFDLPGGRKVVDRDVLLANQRGYNVAIWQKQGITYSLVSDLDESEILEMLESASRESNAQ